MSDALILPCPHCDTPNRVPAARLGDGGACGRCKRPLFTGRPIALDAARFDRHAPGALPLLVDFWAGWCGPCRAMAPAFEAAAAALEPRLRFAKVDTEAEPQLAARHHIRAIPTLVLFHHGYELARHSGLLSAADLARWIERHLGSAGAHAAT